MRRRAWLTLWLLLGAILGDFVVRFSAIHNNQIAEASELTEGLLLLALVGFGAFALCSRFKTQLLFFIFAAIAFGLVTAMTQALVEMSKINGQVPESHTFTQLQVLYRAISNITLSVCCFACSVCFYFYRDALIMFDFSSK